MNRKLILACSATVLIGLATLAPSLSAETIQYQVTVDTSGFAANTPGFIDLQFNQANTGSLSGFATITGFRSSGYTFDDPATVFSTGVTGSFASLPLTIPNDVGGVNYYAQGVAAFGSHFTFALTLGGPVIGGTANDPSEFFVILEDETGAPLFSGEVASVTVNSDGSTTPAGSRFTGGSASVTAVPEPSSLLTLLTGCVVLALRFRR